MARWPWSPGRRRASAVRSPRHSPSPAPGALLLTGRDQARGDLVAKQISDTGVPTVFIGGELADPDVPGRLVGACVERFGRIDLLANAAGLTDRASLLDGTLDDWASCSTSMRARRSS